MNQINLSNNERDYLRQYVIKGTKKARSIRRANILLLADEGYSNDEIAKVLNVHRQTIWRVKTKYNKEGLDSTLEEKPRSGQPKKYKEKHEAEIIALACTTPPRGNKRWTIRLLTDEIRKKKGFQSANRESVRLILKKRNKTLVEEEMVYFNNNSRIQKTNV